MDLRIFDPKVGQSLGARTNLCTVLRKPLTVNLASFVNATASIVRMESFQMNCNGTFWNMNATLDRGWMLPVVRVGDKWKRWPSPLVMHASRSKSVEDEQSRGEKEVNFEPSESGVQLSAKQKDTKANVPKKGQRSRRESTRMETEVTTEEEEEEIEKGYKMSKICDRLIEVFLTEKTSPADWRNLLALSQEWTRIRPHFFKRCETKAKAEKSSKKKRELLKLAQGVKEVDVKMIQYDELLADIEKNEFRIDILVAKRRKEFTGEFFDHLQVLSNSSPKVNRQDEVVSLAGKCLSAIEAHDAALEDIDAIGDAQLKFDEILNSHSLEAASDKIKRLARSKELDSTLLLLITRACSAAEDSTTIRQEAKDIMSHLYTVAKASMLQLIPDEIRIIKHLLAIQDPRDRFAALTKAFSPGDDLEDKDESKLHTKPDKLRHWIKLVLDAYHTNRQTTMIKEAQKLMNPQVITRLEMLLEYMDEQFV